MPFLYTYSKIYMKHKKLRITDPHIVPYQNKMNIRILICYPKKQKLTITMKECKN